MTYPSITSYLEAIQLPDSFKDLVGIEPILNSNNEPIIISGGFAIVFKMHFKGKNVAIKCFINESCERVERYAAVADYLMENPSSYFVTFKFYEAELFIDGEEYPVVLMDWVDGKTLGSSMLDAYNKRNSNLLRLQASKLLDMFLFLLHEPIAHGDLKHENIMVNDNGELILVDYDGMYIPTLAGKQSVELGSKGYQHPERNSTWFNQDLDNFSMLVLMLTHLYLAELPENCTIESSGQLIIEADFKNLNKSQINFYSTFKIGRQLAAFLYDVLEEKDLLKGVCYLFRTVNTLMIEINNKEFIIKDNTTKVNVLIGDYYFAKGIKYEDGDGVPQDYVKAMECYSKSADLGNSNSMNRIGFFFSEGHGVDKDCTIALKWFLLAEDLGNTNAKFNIRVLYSQNYKVRGLNHKVEIDRYLESATLGNITSIIIIAFLLRKLPNDAASYRKREVVEWYEKAAALNNVHSMLELGNYYQYDNYWDYKKAMEWFLKAAELGSSDAMNRIGLLFRTGKGFDLNDNEYSKSYDWFLKAADKGNCDAMINIAKDFVQWPNKDYINALKWYKMAADKGNTNAMIEVGLIYEKGLGVAQDYELAMEWYQKAAKKDNWQAFEKISSLYYRGLGVVKDSLKADKFSNESHRLRFDKKMFLL